MRGLLSEGWSKMTRFLNVNKMLDDRLKLTVEEYENLFDGKSIGKNCLGKSLFKYDGLKSDRREYSPLPQDNSLAENV
jgi:hypothetical protein